MRHLLQRLLRKGHETSGSSDTGTLACDHPLELEVIVGYETTETDRGEPITFMIVACPKCGRRTAIPF